MNRDQYAKSYSISNVSCVNTTTNDCSLLSFTFKASEATLKKIPKYNVKEIIEPGEYWVDVNIANKILTLFIYDKPIFATYVATGKPVNPTITGTYRVWYKLLKRRMRGQPPVADHYYDLPNVPWVMFYYRGFSIYGTYWHDKFGTQQSAGCTNVTNGDAEFIFSKTLPLLSDNQDSVFSSDINPGTVIYNHY